MLQQILCPLDGSAPSERSLAYAGMLARASGATLTLFRAFDPLTWSNWSSTGMGLAPSNYYAEKEAIHAKAGLRMAHLRDDLGEGGVTTVKWELVEGEAARALLNYQEINPPDLCVMATHGRSGVERMALGSVADRMVREGPAPVLLVPISGTGEPRLARALVPLDGSQLAEEALSMVEALAGKPLESARLMMALGDHSVRVPGNGDRPADDTVATKYLESIADRLKRSGLTTAIQVYVVGAVEAIQRAASGMDMVIMSTHGRGGLDRLRNGSVAGSATTNLGIPRLLVRAKRD